MDYKSETKKAYDLYAKEFDVKFKTHLKKIVGDLDFFIHALPGKKVLDLGSGPGNHALYFKERGLDVLCGDISEEMVKIAKERGLHAEVMDIENIEFPDESYDGVWAYYSLLHISKEKILFVIEKIWKILAPQGIFCFGFQEGTTEEFKTQEKYPGTKRWFIYFTEDEIKKLTEKYFNIIYTKKRERDASESSTHHFFTYILKKK